MKAKEDENLKRIKRGCNAILFYVLGLNAYTVGKKKNSMRNQFLWTANANS